MRKAFRIPILLLIIAGACYWIVRGRGPESLPSSARGRDVIIITMDTTRRDHLGCYGYERATSPNIDRYSDEGVRFERAYCAAPITLPAHTTILTGVDPPKHGVHNNGTYRLAASATTLAECFRDADYDTAAFISAFVLDRSFGLAQGFDEFDDALAEDGARQTRFTMLTRTADQTIERAIAWLEQRDPERPFFLWIHLFDPHAPYTPPASAEQDFGPDARDRYDGEILAMDRQIGRFRKAYDATGRRAVTAIVADHGEGLSDHGEASHGVLLYDETVHIPLIVHAPGLIAPATNATIARQSDVMPTLLELCGLAAPEGLDGESLVKALAGETLGRRAFVESWMSLEDYGWSPLFAAIDDRFKIIDAPIPECYESGADAGERNNIARRERARVEAATAALTSWRQRRAATAERISASDQQLAALQQIGYVSGSGLNRGGERLPNPVDVIDILDQLEQARMMIDGGRALDAFALLKIAATRDPGNGTLLNLLGNEAIRVSRRLTGEGREQCLAYAEFAFQTFLERAPDRADGHYGMALVDQARDRQEEARERFTYVASTFPDHLRACQVLLEFARKERDAARMRQLAEQILKYHPEHVGARLDLARIQFLTGDVENAREHLTRLLDADEPARSRVHFWLGSCEEKLGRHDRALTHYEGVTDPELRRRFQVERLIEALRKK